MQLYPFCILYCWTTSSFLVDEDYCGDASGEKGRGKSCRISRVFLKYGGFPHFSPNNNNNPISWDSSDK